MVYRIPDSADLRIIPHIQKQIHAGAHELRRVAVVEARENVGRWQYYRHMLGEGRGVDAPRRGQSPLCHMTLITREARLHQMHSKSDVILANTK